MRKKTLITGILAVAVASNAIAKDIDGAVFLTPQVGLHFFDGERKTQDSKKLTGGLAIEKILKEDWGIGAYLGYGKVRVKPNGDKKSFFDGALYGLKYFKLTDSFLPYISLGIGNSKIGTNPLGVFASLGFNYFVSDNWALSASVKDYFLTKGRNDVVATLGLTYAFGVKPSQVDSDGDGVFDNLDKCPGTPEGVKVDSEGCPVDTDKDGVADYKDKCPDTPAGVKVNSEGCPVDTDKDGVADYLDKCPDTPLGVKVDSNGCPLDSDKDGVADYKDKCPGTPEGVKVDSEGCPVDTDKDGVADYKDKCPDTPAGVKVNSEGCPVDTDKDGVADYLDKCPDTPLGVKVDSNGCPLDSDKDGVPDYMDKCPSTPEGAQVDSNGCLVIAKLEIHFDTNSAYVKPEYYKEIEKFAKYLKENPDVKIEIQGHTDSRGSAKYNLILSQKRAEAVKKILVEKFGISPDRIVAKGYGETKPIAPNDTPEGRALNRRVVIVPIK